MSNVITWVTANGSTIAAYAAIIIIAGERIAALTATPEDDKWFSWIHKFLAGVGLKFPEDKS